MRIKANGNLHKLAKAFKEAGYTLYITGGYVRDSLLYGYTTKTDIDIAAAAPIEKVKSILSDANSLFAGGNNTAFDLAGDAVGGTQGKSLFCLKERNSALGTVAIVAENREVYEYTTFRRDSYRGGAHSPVGVTFVGSVEEDALRRDFTVNSIYYDIADDEIVDPAGGVQDLRNKLLRTPDKPETTFGSDGLRLLRLARFAALLGFNIEEKTKAAAIKTAALIKDITRPRINEEFFKILEAEDGGAACRGLKLLVELGLLFYIVPELAISNGFAQNKKWHEFDVLEHIFKTVKYAAKQTRMAALLHDIGKPESENKFGNSQHHTEIALEIAPKILREFGYSDRRAASVLRLIEHHMYDLDSRTGESKVKKFLLFNQDILDDLLDLKQADYFASGKYKAGDICPTVTKWKNIYAKMQNGPLHIKDLAVTPEELIKELDGIMPRTDTARTMEKLLVAVVVEGVKNERGILLRRARSFY